MARAKQPAPRPALTPEQEIQWGIEANYRSYRHRRGRAIDEGRSAIATMRRFIDDAERSLDQVVGEKGDDKCILDAITAVMHRITWGWANASGDLALAVAAAAEAMQIGAEARAAGAWSLSQGLAQIAAVPAPEAARS